MDLATEVGYLKGMQEGTQREVQRLAGEQTKTASEVAETKGMVFSMQGQVEGLRSEVRELTQSMKGTGVQKAIQPESTVSLILKSPVTPMIVVAVSMAIVLIVVFSRDTGRSASSFVPSVPHETAKETGK